MVKKPLPEMTLEELWQLFPIVLHEYDPAWPLWFKEEETLLKRVFGSRLYRIRHIGSTSVPGLAAKPTVDILLEAVPACSAAELRELSRTCGYTVMAETPGEEYRLDLCKGYTPNGFAEKVFHLHIRYPGDWDEAVFCAYLRRHPESAAEYAALKKELWKKFEHDRNGYTDAKTDFIRLCTKKAREEMLYQKSRKYDTPEFLSRIMGPNPIKLAEELLTGHQIAPGVKVLDLGSGQGVTSVFLAQEYDFQVYAGDLWSDPQVNRKFFDSCGLTQEQIIPVKADGEALPFEKEFFDAVVSLDSYNYFGRNPEYLDAKLLPFVKPGGLLYFAFPGMKKDLHHDLPPELLLSWTPEQLDYLHDITYWKKIFQASRGSELLSLREMQSNEEVWNDWLKCDNKFAVNDRKSMLSGGGKYLNFISVVLRKKSA